MTNPDEAPVKEPSEAAWIAATMKTVFLHAPSIRRDSEGIWVSLGETLIPPDYEIMISHEDAQAEQERMDRENEVTDEMVKAAVIYFHGERFLPNEAMFKGMSNAIKAALKARPTNG